jgi:hypothetical protein
MSTGAPIPPADDEDDDLVKAGDWGEVRYARRQNGRMEAKEWLLESATESEAIKFDHLFRKMAHVGKIVNEEHFRLLEDGIWEFKRDGNRILCFQHKRCWLLTHHYPKGGKAKCPRSEIEKARTIRTEFFSA